MLVAQHVSKIGARNGKILDVIVFIGTCNVLKRQNCRVRAKQCAKELPGDQMSCYLVEATPNFFCNAIANENERGQNRYQYIYKNNV